MLFKCGETKNFSNRVKMSAQVETSFSLFDSSSYVLDQADLIELVSGATLRNSPPSRMVTSSPILMNPPSGGISGTCLTRPSSPSLESAFNILGDQVSVYNFFGNDLVAYFHKMR